MRSVSIGLAVAFCLILLQTPIRQGAFLLIHPTDEVREMATLYFHICIWGAPAMLGLYGLTGWFIGMQNSRIPMYIAITQNVVNIIASLGLVYLCGMKVEGVALGTLIAQHAGFLMGIVLWMHNYGRLKRFWEIKNYKLKIKGGEGAGIWEKAFTDTVRHLFGWGAVIAVLFTLVYALGGNAFLGLLTDDKEVIAVADTYFYWALAVPAVASLSVPPPREECSSPWQRQLSAFLSYIMGCIPSWQTMLYGLPSSLTC